MKPLTKEERDKLRREAGRAMTSAAWEYCPSELFQLLDDLDAKDERIARLEAALRDSIQYATEYGDFSNGVTCPNGVIDEGRVNAAKVFEQIAKALNEGAAT